MSNGNESVNRRVRAQYHREAARECERRGYPTIASVNWAMAEMLDPTPKEAREVRPRREEREPRPALNLGPRKPMLRASTRPTRHQVVAVA